MCEYTSYTWFLTVIGGDERIGIEERGGKDGVDVEIGGKGVGRDGEYAELTFQM